MHEEHARNDRRVSKRVAVVPGRISFRGVALKRPLAHGMIRIDKVKALCILVHTCDISHPAKEFPLHEKWTGMILEEFFRQGDQEKAMEQPVSPLCDRNTVQMQQSQIGRLFDILVRNTLSKL